MLAYTLYCLEIYLTHLCMFVKPAEPKWYMLIGSCYRRAGHFQLALQTYKDVDLDAFAEELERQVSYYIFL